MLGKWADGAARNGRASPRPCTQGEPVIANLLPPDDAVAAFATLDARRLRRVEERLASARASWPHLRRSAFDADFLDELEELDSEASSVVLEALLDRIEDARRASLTRKIDSARGDAHDGQPASGRLLLHRFAASLGTGEAEVAARGFFDAWDRPPLSLWLEALSRPLPRRRDASELSVLVYVPADSLDAAVAGRGACSSGALRFLDEVDGELRRQLLPLLSRAPG